MPADFSNRVVAFRNFDFQDEFGWCFFHRRTAVQKWQMRLAGWLLQEVKSEANSIGIIAKPMPRRLLCTWETISSCTPALNKSTKRSADSEDEMISVFHVPNWTRTSNTRCRSFPRGIRERVELLLVYRIDIFSLLIWNDSSKRCKHDARWLDLTRTV